ncbi:MAG: hypothetical protein V1790_12605 [Planctomycetota bacterium]
MDEYVSLKELAITLGMDRSHARRYVLKLGYQPVKQRTADSGNQLALCVTRLEADAILERRAEQGFLATGGAIVQNEFGCLYAIQLVPDLDHRRIKLGFAVDVTDRLNQHRTAAPTARLLKTWACRRTWEAAAIESIALGCRHIGGEVFECSDPAEMVARGDAFFAIMPALCGQGSL